MLSRVEGGTQQTWLLISPQLLHKIRGMWEKDASHIMLWVACTTYFFSFFRAEEIKVPAKVEVEVKDTANDLCPSGAV